MKIIEQIGNRKRVAIRFTENSETDQSFKDECNVNIIIAKFRKTGQITHLAKSQGTYADVSEIPDLLGAYEQVRLAEQAFATVPAELRKKLDNDPQKFIEFLNDPKNNEEAVKYGLKDKIPQNDDKTTKKESTSSQNPPADIVNT